jgi:hypothetical protein
VSVDVKTSSGCSWTATSHTSWVTVQSGATGNGSGTVQLIIAANSGAERTGSVTIAGKSFTITQAPAACTYSIVPTVQPVPLLGGAFSVAITTRAWCGWTASTSNSWIRLRGASSGTGNSTLAYDVDALLLGSRTGTIRIAGQTLTVNQSGLLGVGP